MSVTMGMVVAVTAEAADWLPLVPGSPVPASSGGRYIRYPFEPETQKQQTD